MKVPAKPASSPARTDKFPTPLMSFLKSNVGSKSRGGRSRSSSSPMFVKKKKSSAIETQEPSSPKVTCMGQVRTRKTSKQDEAQTRHKCHWIPTAFFCPHFSAKTKRKGWASGFNFGFRRKSETGKDSAKTETVVAGRTGYSEQDEEDEEENELGKGFVPFVYSPPKNALILTRSRSAPYRSSSLAGRFYGSPLVTDNRAAEQKTELEKTEIQKPESPGDSVPDQGIKQSEEKIRFYKQVEESIRENIRKLETTEKVKTGEPEKEVEVGASSRPPILTRSKSVPSRISEKLSPE